MDEKIVVLVSCASLGEATTIGEAVIAAGLAACANIGTHSLSLFRWQGELKRATEYPLLLKSSRAHFAALAGEIRRLHAYECPEILAMPVVAADADYEKWMEEVLAPQPQP